MEVALAVLASSVALELVALWAGRGRLSDTVAAVAVIAAALASGALIVLRFDVVTSLIVGLSAYRVVNLLRVVEARMQPVYLRGVTCTASLWLIGLQAAALLAWIGYIHIGISEHSWLVVLAGAQLLIPLLLLISTLRSLQKTKVIVDKTAMSDTELPPITIAVPARNEDTQLEACLQSILASDYPKLEVIVLDDCSQDHTSDIIRTFAHDGVRFIAGHEPKANWLAKNQAYAQLADAASGEMVLFCGVDVRFETDTVRKLVTTLIKKDKVMLSVMPRSVRSGLSLPQSMRAYWELALPRRQFNRPPVFSSCWLIRAKALRRFGGFAAVKHAITPEAHFAREAAAQDGYSFLRSDDQLGLTSVKSLREQRATAIRTRYPQVRRRPEFVALTSLLELTLLLGPFSIAIIGVWAHFGITIEVLTILSSLLLCVIYVRLSAAIFGTARLFAVVLFPFAVLSDIVLLNYSMWKYEFSEVIWKGRNICLPVMHAHDHLPEN